MRRLDTRYRSIRSLTGSGTARIELVQDRLLTRPAVLKLLAAEHGSAVHLIAESKVLEVLRHPGIVAFVERFEGRLDFDEQPCVGHATAWVDGVDLRRWARGRDPAEKLAAIAQIVDAVSYLHRNGWLHLDLKPDNILVGPSGPVLLDLGSMCRVDAQAGTAGGTLGFAAPEVVAGQAPAIGSDIYAIGVLLYLLMVGESPFVATAGSELREATLRGDLVAPRARQPDLDRELAALIESLLATKLADRPDDLSQVRDALGSLGAPTSTRAGRPVLIGRGALVEDVVELLAAPELAPPVVALVGPMGIGRSRVACEILHRAPRDDGAVALDLSALGPAEASLPRLLGLLGAPGAGRLDDPRLPGWLQERSLDGTVYLGRVEDSTWLAHPGARQIVRAIGAAGLTILLASEFLPDWAESYAVGELPTSELRALPTALGVSDDPTTTALIEQVGGNPGHLIDRLTVPTRDLRDRARALGEGWPVLQRLPGGFFAADLADAPEPMAGLVDRALALGLLRRVGSRLVPCFHPSEFEPLHPDGQRVIAAAFDHLDGADPVLRALLAARAGLHDRAIALLPHAEAQPARPEAFELARRLADAGHLPGVYLVAHILLARKRDEEAGPYLDRLPPEAPATVVLRSAWSRSYQRPESWEAPLAWIGDHGWHPEVAGAAAWFLLSADRRDALRAFLARVAAEAPDEVRRHERVAAAELAVLHWRAEAEGPSPELRAQVEGIGAGGQELPRLVCHQLAVLWRALREPARALEVELKVVELTDREGLLQSAAIARLNLANSYLQLGRPARARQAYVQAESLALAAGLRSTLLRIYASVGELEVHLGRLASAERYIERFEAVRDEVGTSPMAEGWGKILRGWLEAARDQHRRVLEGLSDFPTQGVIPPLRMERLVLLAEAHVELEAPERVLEHLDQLDEMKGLASDFQQRSKVARARALFAIARSKLRNVVADLPDNPSPLERDRVGRALLAAAGEDLSVDSFPERRAMLRRASELVHGERRLRADELRDRLLDRPGAALDQIVDLIEKIGEGEQFLEALARVVANALGANRVLVMLRMPGLGQQLSAREISGQEVAGLAPEVWNRVQRVDDVWRADDAFADPNLRLMSSTVRTFQIKSVVAVAIPRDDQVIGALYVDDLQRAGRFGDADVIVLQRVARAIGKVADLIPSRAVDDGLRVHDVHGVYLSSEPRATRMRQTLDRLQTLPQANLLVSGPTGAGKTWLASRIATEVLGLRGMVEVVLRPSDPDKLISLLWGTRRGEFTGAIDQVGAIQRAWFDRKVLFLDEVQNLDETGQRVLLPLLELPHRRFGAITGEVQQLDRPLHIILGTNAALDDGAWSLTFREDLWFRMSQIRVDLPSLAERGSEAIYRHLGDMLSERGLPSPERVFDSGALHRIAHHTWPGNLRGLSGFADLAAFHRSETGDLLGESDLRALGLLDRPAPTEAKSNALQSAEAKVLLQTLESCGWVQTEAARDLGISKYALHRMLKRHDLLDTVRAHRFGMEGAR